MKQLGAQPPMVSSNFLSVELGFSANLGELVYV